MQATKRIRMILTALFVALAVVTLIGATVWTPGGQGPSASPVSGAAAPAPMVGTFTGEFDNGAPVYRLPSISVTASRSEALAAPAR